MSPWFNLFEGKPNKTYAFFKDNYYDGYIGCYGPPAKSVCTFRYENIDKIKMTEDQEILKLWMKEERYQKLTKEEKDNYPTVC